MKNTSSMTKTEQIRKKCSQALILEYPIMITPELARQVGLNLAVVIQGIHNAMEEANFSKTGNRIIQEDTWIQKTVQVWRDEYFTFWSIHAVRKHFQSLKKLGVLLSKKSDSVFLDPVLLYSIDWEKLSQIEEIAK